MVLPQSLRIIYTLNVQQIILEKKTNNVNQYIEKSNKTTHTNSEKFYQELKNLL